MNGIGITDSDECLLSKLQNHDEKGLELLMEKYSVPLCAFCNGFIENFQQCEEIVADVFYSIWFKQILPQIHTSLKSYLYVCVKNNALQLIRNENRRVSKTDNLYSGIECSEPNALQQFVLADLHRGIEILIETLPRKRKRIFQLNRCDGLTVKEIAGLLNITEKSVVNQVCIAAKQLRSYHKKIENLFS